MTSVKLPVEHRLALILQDKELAALHDVRRHGHERCRSSLPLLLGDVFKLLLAARIVISHLHALPEMPHERSFKHFQILTDGRELYILIFHFDVTFLSVQRFADLERALIDDLIEHAYKAVSASHFSGLLGARLNLDLG